MHQENVLCYYKVLNRISFYLSGNMAWFQYPALESASRNGKLTLVNLQHPRQHVMLVTLSLLVRWQENTLVDTSTAWQPCLTGYQSNGVSLAFMMIKGCWQNHGVESISSSWLRSDPPADDMLHQCIAFIVFFFFGLGWSKLRPCQRWVSSI